ncbi:MAG: hypothetical protein JWN03_3718 [Nocardia sp.]|uniref:hypothetical protein n=1 Tax=Nocardia sp. TaxID=1821 RepID=UPI002635B7FD|nr:hypothetical protein [Nocardia sp.]MCU1643443.1 hypothetical protein [Nocardia sp.]
MSTPQVPGSPDTTVADVLRGTALGPMLDRPINDILRDMGVSALPQLPPAPPLPGLPPLPVIDLSALTRPLTDLAQSFGTGQISGASVDPMQVLSGVSSALQQVVSLASSLMSVASSLWQGQGATGAADKGAAAQSDALELQTQNVQQKTVLGGAATTVGIGAASMAAVITKFVTAVTVSAPFLVTPPGQAFLLSMASETAAEATAVVAHTRAQLTVHNANMTVAGQKVAVTNAPKGVDSLSQVTQLLSGLQTLASSASSGAQQLQSIAQTLTAQPVDETTAPVDQPITTTAGSTPGSAVPISGGLGAAGPAQLGQWTGTRSTAAPGGSPAPAAEPAAAPRAATTGPGMAPPMGGAGAGLASRAGEADDDSDIRTNLVTGEHGDDVVGELGNTGVPVVGASGSATPRVPTTNL